MFLSFQVVLISLMFVQVFLISLVWISYLMIKKQTSWLTVESDSGLVESVYGRDLNTTTPRSLLLRLWLQMTSSPQDVSVCIWDILASFLETCPCLDLLMLTNAWPTWHQRFIKFDYLLINCSCGSVQLWEIRTFIFFTRIGFIPALGSSLLFLGSYLSSCCVYYFESLERKCRVWWRLCCSSTDETLTINISISISSYSQNSG